MNPEQFKKVSGAINARMKELKINTADLTRLLGYPDTSLARVDHWVKGMNGPNQEACRKLVEKLGVSPSVFEGIMFFGGPNRGETGGKKRGTPRTPASRAVALAEAHARAEADAEARRNGGQALIPLTTALPHVVSDVFSCRVRSDGTMQVKLDTNLPLMQGMALMKFLMEFGLVADQQQGSA
jgi:hypothetical protein